MTRLGTVRRSSILTALRGFTLIEVLVSIGILLTILAIAIPNWRHNLAERQLEGAAQNVFHLLRLAREEAISNSAATVNIDFSQSDTTNGVIRVNITSVTGSPASTSTLDTFQSDQGVFLTPAPVGISTSGVNTYTSQGIPTPLGQNATVTVSSNSVTDQWKMTIDEFTGGVSLLSPSP